ncbi:MAG: pantoate--beta-alanine ligase, partial [Gallionella sp.]
LRARLSTESAIAFVPTMGNLHEGHLNLMREARNHGDCVVASLFVNPLQFGPNEDFDQYPRTLDADSEKLQGLVDIIFAPTVNEMYPVPQDIFVALPPVAAELCGAARPGHFCGMATVVLKLLNIVQPQVALFGKKDYQQLYLIRHLVAQLNLPIKIVGVETVRALDGLALSSRNQYLTPDERGKAAFLRQVLLSLSQAILQGEGDYTRLQQDAFDDLLQRGWAVDYVSIRRQSDLQVATHRHSDLVILAAAKLGQSRLLDNVELVAD